jgi:branched-chain amino acid transport system ATP-binding protein
MFSSLRVRVGADADVDLAGPDEDSGHGILDVRGLSVSWGAGVAVSGASLSVRPGKVSCLLGANGAGKSSILNGISGIAPRITGSVQLDGDELVGRRPWSIVRAGVVHVPQGRIVFPGLSVLDNLRMGGFVRDRRVVEERLEFVFDLFPGLAERAKVAAGRLSGGEQQMVAIGRGLLAQPRILLIDEMSLGLAPKVVLELFDHLHRVAEQGIGILIVEQLANLALGHSDYAYIMRTGGIVVEGPAADLARDEQILRSAYLGDTAIDLDLTDGPTPVAGSSRSERRRGPRRVELILAGGASYPSATNHGH